MKVITFVVLLMVGAVLSITPGEIETQWKQFKLNFNKNYKTPEKEAMRKEKFIENLERIEKHNKRYQQKLESYTQGVTRFADLTPDEFQKCHTSFDYNIAKKNWNKYEVTTFPKGVPVPTSANWSHALGDIRDIVKCPASWAFSAVATVEAVNTILTKEKVVLSPQNLIDCTYNQGNHGCKDGWYGLAFEYIVNNNGISTERDYPFRNISDNQKWCEFEPSYVGARISGYGRTQAENEEDLKFAVAKFGPVSVVVHNYCFQLYKDGIIDCKPCGDRLNHAVTVIGYGRDKGLDYWLVRNCWGRAWGETGNARLIRNKYNQCGIASMPMFVYV